MATDKKINYKDQRLTKAQQKKTKPANQGGGPNYLGKQETATVPKKWLSSPDHVVAELAYITPREQKILLDANIYGSLKGKPNKGPGGIMSLQGDLGGYDASPGGPDSESGDGSGGSNDKARAADIMRGNVTTGQTVAVSDRTRRGAMPEVAYGPDGRAKMMYAQKAAGNPQGFLGRLFSGNNQYGYRDTNNQTGGFMGFGGQEDVRFNPTTQRYEFEEEETGDVKPSRGGQILGGLAGLFTGMPGVGSFIGRGMDKFKNKSYMQKQTPEELSRMKGLQMVNGKLVDTRMLDFNPNAQIQKPINVPMDNLYLNNFNQQPTVSEIKPPVNAPQTYQPSYNINSGIPEPSGIINTNNFTSSDGLGFYDG